MFMSSECPPSLLKNRLPQLPYFVLIVRGTVTRTLVLVGSFKVACKADRWMLPDVFDLFHTGSNV